jgi:hypothetical protein
VRQTARAAADRWKRVQFTRKRDAPGSYQHQVCSYDRPLICYPGQERAFDGKRHNIALALAAVDGTVIAPGETFSFWHSVGRPTERAGYRRAAALKRGVLTEDVGGALCLASTLLYNVALLGGLEIVERRCHSVDSYGPARYFELGRDAAVEYAYIDLRFRNRHASPVILRARIEDDAVVAELRSADVIVMGVEIGVDTPFVACRQVTVRAERVVTCEDRVLRETWWSTHNAPWLPAGDSHHRIAADTIVIAPSVGEGDRR